VRVFLERQRNVLPQRHRREKGAPLVHHADSPQKGVPPVEIRMSKVDGTVEDLSAGRILEPEKVAHERGLTAPAPSHDDEDITLMDVKG
jgi:hypothetical protein